jgi:glycosyltransferase involved in cell wall biosynthesis
MTASSLRRAPAIALVSTYPPTQCGLATFTAALHEQLPGSSVVRVMDADGARVGNEVVAHLVNGSDASAAVAVRTLNTHDVVILQHEYGIYGGPDGEDVLAVVDALCVPLVVVLHTVLETPSPRQRSIVLRLLVVADVVVTMTETARRRLIDGYGADPAQVVVIVHGAVDHGRLGLARTPRLRPTILTWGLLGPGKGIEWALDAVAELRDLDPRYLVLGKTHPKVLDHEGERYRDGLTSKASRLGIEDLVELDPSYLSVRDLAEVVADADVILLPYDSREQVTSGVLIEAVAAGRPVVSTAFPHAVELLADGPGLVVPQRDAQALAAALRRVLTEPGLADRMAASAVTVAPTLLWSAVAQQYLLLAEGLVRAVMTEAS